MTQSRDKGVALITGASTGIGAVYADRLAKRGYDLILVARDEARLETLAARLRAEAGVAVRVLKADLTDHQELGRVEEALRHDERVTLLVNNAGAALPGGFADNDANQQEWLLDLNVVSLTRLTSAVVPGFLARGSGTIVNIASVLAYVPDMLPGIYSATKAYVAGLSQSLQHELGPRGIHVQAVLPAATRTEIWERSGRDVDSFPDGTVMAIDDLVDAALVGLDRGELITLPSLPDESQWSAFEAARGAMASNFANGRPAARYAS